MNREAAEKFTSGLGQVMGGSIELIKYAEENGVHTALDMTLQEWVNDSLGGYVRLPSEARREIARELVEEGGYTKSKAAEILGVTEGTIRNDLRPQSYELDDDRHSIEANSIGRRSQNYESGKVDPETGEIFDDEPPPHEEVDPSDPASFLKPMPEQEEPAEEVDWDAKVEDMMPPDKKEELQRTRLRHAFSDAMVAVTSKLTPLKTSAIAEAYTADEWDSATRSLKGLREWIDRLEYDRANIDTGLRVIHRKDA